MERISCDVLIIGSGAAGLRAAIAAAQPGMDVCVMTKGSPGKGTCTYFSGGVMAGSPPDSPVDRHLDQTLQAGRGINRQDLARIFSEEAPHRLKEMLDWGMEGQLRGGYLYAAGRPPIWGKAIIQCLLEQTRKAGIRFLDGMVAADLVVEGGIAAVLAVSAESGMPLTVRANAVILATGGAAALFQRHDNPRRIVGDGYRLALSAGAALQDIEFVQFYPLGLAEPGYPPFLIPPGVADAGRLYTGDGEDILEKYAITERPAAERARDALSRALFMERFRHGRDVWLDVSGLPESAWENDPFSASTRQIFGEKYGAAHRPVRVAPLAHHVMGGICIDSDGATAVPGLYAAGEVTGGLHGANRMGGNALTDTLVFGARAGKAAAAYARRNFPERSAGRITPETRLQPPTPTGDKNETENRLADIRRIMWEDGGLVRNRDGLHRAIRRIDEIKNNAEADSPGDRPRPQGVVELQSAALTAHLILEAALKREESRGAHFREDFPDLDDKWQGNLQVRLHENGKPQWRFRPVDNVE